MRFIPLLAGLTLCVTTAAPIQPAVAASDRGHPAVGGRIVFSADRSGSLQLYTVRPDGSGLRRITDREGFDLIHADWSPDGRRIVFELDTETTAQIAQVNADGSGFEVLPIAGPYVGQPAFAPSGRRVFFERFDGETVDAIFTARLDGRRDRQVSHPPEGTYDTDPNVAPDGRRLSFVRVKDERGEAALFVVDLTTGRESQVTAYDANVAIKHDWSPSGRRLTFTRDGHTLLEGISSNVRTIRPDGACERAVTRYVGGEVNALVGSYSPDGRRIAFRREQGSTYSLVTIRPDGRRERAILTSPDLVPRFIDWGPGAGR